MTTQICRSYYFETPEFPLLAVKEPETTETSPSGVASTEVVRLVNLVQVIDVFVSQVYGLALSVQSERLHSHNGRPSQSRKDDRENGGSRRPRQVARGPSVLSIIWVTTNRGP